MVAKHIYLTEEQVTFLESFDTTPLAEHVRRALDAYIDSLKPSARTSPSMMIIQGRGAAQWISKQAQYQKK